MSSVNRIQTSSSWTSSGWRLEALEGPEPRLLVARGVERDPVPRPGPPVPLRPELGPGPEEREVDVEQDGAKHRVRIRRTQEIAGGQTHATPADTSRDGPVAAAKRTPSGRLCPAAGGDPAAGIRSSGFLPCGKIGVPRFELGTSPTRTERATRLRHTPSRERVAVSRSVDSRRGSQGRDRRARERAPRDRALPGVRPAGPPGRRRGRGDDDRVRRLVLARALRARGGPRRGARARPPRAVLAERAARRRRTASRAPRGALPRKRLARRVPPGARRASDAREQRAARGADRGDAGGAVRVGGPRVHDRAPLARGPRRARLARRSSARRSSSPAATARSGASRSRPAARGTTSSGRRTRASTRC